MIAAIMMAAASVNAQEERTVDAYFTADEMPDMRLFMPGPPDSTSVAFANDVSRYFWGKEMRMDPERAEQVKRDAVYGLATIIEEFEEAFGMKISQEQTQAPPPATASARIPRPPTVARGRSSVSTSTRWHPISNQNSTRTSHSPRATRSWAGVRHC